MRRSYGPSYGGSSADRLKRSDGRRAEAPGDAVGVLHHAVAVAPELERDRHDHGAAGGDGTVEPALGVLDMEMQVEAVVRCSGVAVLGHRVYQHDRAPVHVDPGVHEPPVLHLGALADLLGTEGALVELDRGAGVVEHQVWHDAALEGRAGFRSFEHGFGLHWHDLRSGAPTSGVG